MADIDFSFLLDLFASGDWVLFGAAVTLTLLIVGLKFGARKFPVLGSVAAALVKLVKLGKTGQAPLPAPAAQKAPVKPGVEGIVPVKKVE